MQKLSVAVLLACISLMVTTESPAAKAKTAKCYFAVNGKTFINGACNFEFMNGDGSFSFDDMKLKTKCLSYDLGPGQCSTASTGVTRKGTFGQLVITSPGRAKIYWNGGNAIHAHGEISPVTRNGACWQNNQAKLCAW
jgi:hypothetical protein